jgi:hypothetical protein
MYVAPVPFAQLGFPPAPNHAPPDLTEAIQHGVFRLFIPPVALFSVLGVAMHALGSPEGDAAGEGTEGRP